MIQVTDHLAYESPSRLRELLWWLRFLLDRRGLDQRSIAHHYDRPPDFFLAWLDRTRSYTHGFYASPDDDPTAAQIRKLQFAIDALGLEPGMEVFDMGCGWGAFLEYAGARGIRVQGITLSRDQHAFVSERIRALEASLPRRVRGLSRLSPRSRLRRRRLHGKPGAPPRLPAHGTLPARASAAAGGHVLRLRHLEAGQARRRLHDEVHLPGREQLRRRAGTRARSAARGPQRERAGGRHAELRLHGARLGAEPRARRDDARARHGELPVRAFLLYLWSSYHFLATNRTQAYHVVASREPLALPHRRASRSASATVTAQHAEDVADPAVERAPGLSPISASSTSRVRGCVSRHDAAQRIDDAPTGPSPRRAPGSVRCSTARSATMSNCCSAKPASGDPAVVRRVDEVGRRPRRCAAPRRAGAAPRCRPGCRPCRRASGAAASAAPGVNSRMRPKRRRTKSRRSGKYSMNGSRYCLS